jgi:Do/DeqQ family serine protease
MKQRKGIAALGAALLLTGVVWSTDLPTATQAEEQAIQQPQTISRPVLDGRASYADVVNVVAPSVVTVRVQGRAAVAPTGFQLPDDDFFRRFFGDRFGDQRPGDDARPRVPRTYRQRGLGSGVVVTADGYILTNHHVIDGADEITVEFNDRRSFDAKVIGSDELSDLAVLKIDATNLTPVALADSDAAQVGDVVLAVGNPLGVGQTVTMGIVSAKGRQTDGDSYQDFIQTDAPINQGNSGGALVNLKGELLGINSQILSPSQGNIGIGFAIPANMARRVMDDLRRDGRVRRAQLGVTIQEVTPDMAQSLGLKDTQGVIVSSVTAEGAADKAGVKAGDVLKSFDGKAVADMNSLRNRVAETKPGSTATLVIVRDGSEKTLSVKLDERSAGTARRDDADPEADRTALGVAVAPLTPQLAERAGLPKDAHGLVVQDVDPDSRAADAGIQRGDIIREVNREAVRSVEDLRAAVKRTTDRPALVLVQRGDQSLFVTVKPSQG